MDVFVIPHKRSADAGPDTKFSKGVRSRIGNASRFVRDDKIELSSYSLANAQRKAQTITAAEKFKLKFPNDRAHLTRYGFNSVPTHEDIMRRSSTAISLCLSVLGLTALGLTACSSGSSPAAACCGRSSATTTASAALNCRACRLRLRHGSGVRL